MKERLLDAGISQNLGPQAVVGQNGVEAFGYLLDWRSQLQIGQDWRVSTCINEKAVGESALLTTSIQMSGGRGE